MSSARFRAVITPLGARRYGQPCGARPLRGRPLKREVAVRLQQVAGSNPQHAQRLSEQNAARVRSRAASAPPQHRAHRSARALRPMGSAFLALELVEGAAVGR